MRPLSADNSKRRDLVKRELETEGLEQLDFQRFLRLLDKSRKDGGLSRAESNECQLLRIAIVTSGLKVIRPESRLHTVQRAQNRVKSLGVLLGRLMLIAKTADKPVGRRRKSDHKNRNNEHLKLLRAQERKIFGPTINEVPLEVAPPKKKAGFRPGGNVNAIIKKKKKKKITRGEELLQNKRATMRKEMRQSVEFDEEHEEDEEAVDATSQDADDLTFTAFDAAVEDVQADMTNGAILTQGVAVLRPSGMFDRVPGRAPSVGMKLVKSQFAHLGQKKTHLVSKQQENKRSSEMLHRASRPSRLGLLEPLVTNERRMNFHPVRPHDVLAEGLGQCKYCRNLSDFCSGCVVLVSTFLATTSELERAITEETREAAAEMLNVSTFKYNKGPRKSRTVILMTEEQQEKKKQKGFFSQSELVEIMREDMARWDWFHDHVKRREANDEKYQSDRNAFTALDDKIRFPEFDARDPHNAEADAVAFMKPKQKNFLSDDLNSLTAYHDASERHNPEYNSSK